MICSSFAFRANQETGMDKQAATCGVANRVTLDTDLED
jgi:hypothetical protein